jgi:hypothetical protein
VSPTTLTLERVPLWWVEDFGYIRGMAGCAYEFGGSALRTVNGPNDLCSAIFFSSLAFSAESSRRVARSSQLQQFCWSALAAAWHPFKRHWFRLLSHSQAGTSIRPEAHNPGQLFSS